MLSQQLDEISQEQLAVIKSIDYKEGYKRADANKLNIFGISTTMLPPSELLPRPSTSEEALKQALLYARIPQEESNFKEVRKCDIAMIKLRDLNFRFCEGYYSRDKIECSWPCVITSMDKKDQMSIIYKGLLWADIVLIATPIRFGNPGALYYKMIERLNSIHNEMTLRNHHVIRDKVAAFIITGGQDGVQSTAGQMLTFWSELGFMFSRYSYVGWNRGWYAEDTKKNFYLMSRNEEFKKDLRKVVDFAIDLKIRLDNSPTTLIDDYEDNVRSETEAYKNYDRPDIPDEEVVKLRRQSSPLTPQ
jgi:multimeric flavodoxin WrbA